MKRDDRTEGVGPRVRILLDGWRQQAAARGTSLRGGPTRVLPLLGRAGGALLRRRAVRLALTIGTVLVTALVGLVVISSPASADACSPMTNPVACENSKAGAPSSEWDISDSGDDTIQGFATDISVNVGGSINFKIKTTASAYRIDIYRLGYYGGLGARKVATVNPVGRAAAEPARLYHGPVDRDLRLRQLGRVRLMDGPVERRVWRLHREADPYQRRRRQSHHLRGAQRRQYVGPVLPDLRHHLAGLQQLRRLVLLSRRRQRPGVQAQLQPAVRHSGQQRPRLAVRQRDPDAALPGAQRL